MNEHRLRQISTLLVAMPLLSQTSDMSWLYAYRVINFAIGLTVLVLSIHSLRFTKIGSNSLVLKSSHRIQDRNGCLHLRSVFLHDYLQRYTAYHGALVRYRWHMQVRSLFCNVRDGLYGRLAWSGGARNWPK
ncbi:hypothetical protein C8Q79DRAFT_16554 [Trametes meyenii]|nr:hypothetical protein C8Q79DRAFT_16554 [Trametes meyenii]